MLRFPRIDSLSKIAHINKIRIKLTFHYDCNNCSAVENTIGYSLEMDVQTWIEYKFKQKHPAWVSKAGP